MVQRNKAELLGSRKCCQYSAQVLRVAYLSILLVYTFNSSSQDYLGLLEPLMSKTRKV